ncbi:hypothetical protein ACLOJK_018674 [Asimina triloba]
MEQRNPRANKGEVSIHVPFTEELQISSRKWDSMFESQREISGATDVTEINANSGGSSIGPADHAPEKKLTLFALRLAILEKSASGLGALGFLWATVVLLGGFANTLVKTDFWVITIVLLIEGTRIFGRSSELEWQQQAAWSLTDESKYSFQESSHKERRTWVTHEVPLLPCTGLVFLAKNISKFLYWLQLLSASASVTLSLKRLIEQDYGKVQKGDSGKRNLNSALNIFYALALAEALLFLIEKAYWEYKVSFCKLLHIVNGECEFDHRCLASIKRFFYDAYSRCVNGSIFDGLKMDLVSFAVNLLGSNSHEEQLMGIRVLQKFASSERYSDSTLCRIGTSATVMERLVDMLNWKNPRKEETRRSAAEILSKLAGRKQNSLRVAGIPGAMESISSLLNTGRSNGYVGSGHAVPQKNIVADEEKYSVLNLLGLVILKKLAYDHGNCGKIGTTTGLLPKIIDFTHANERLLRNSHAADSQIILVKRSLQIVKMLTRTSGATGEILRHEISEIVFTISNIREILQYGEKQTELQTLGIEVLTSLALDGEPKERIGSTGGFLKELTRLFFNEGLQKDRNPVRVAAGEALAMLTLESELNCKRILKLGAVEKLVEALNSPVLRVHSARILLNLCAYSGEDCFFRLKGVASAAHIILKATMSEESKLQEVAVGLAAQVFKFMDAQEMSAAFDQTGVNEIELARLLVNILRKHHRPSTKVPRIRRFVIELAISMMKSKEGNIQMLKDIGVEKELKSVAETTSELECFNVFAGSVGLSRQKTSVSSLVDIALGLLANGEDQASKY